MYAIIESGNKQYTVKKGDEIDVELLSSAKNDEVKIEKVLFFSDEGKVEIGTPYIKGAHVTAKILRNLKDKKVTTFKYKRKTNYHRTIGHRQNYTRLKIEEIAVK